MQVLIHINIMRHVLIHTYTVQMHIDNTIMQMLIHNTTKVLIHTNASATFGPSVSQMLPTWVPWHRPGLPDCLGSLPIFCHFGWQQMIGNPILFLF